MPMPSRRVRRGDSAGPHDPADAHDARVRPHQPGGDVHQRGLAGAVLAEQRVQLAGEQREIGPAQRVHGAEALVDSLELERGRSQSGRVVVELPFEVEPLAEVGGERLHAEGLGGVVAGVDRR